ncbi:MAG: PAS domain S-box protein, partial [Bacteroidota bacterium]|nr:PAS domain S-box protein [Bacteroidota bacterium]
MLNLIETKFRPVIEILSEGFVICTVERSDDRTVTDFVYQYCNSAFIEMAKIEDKNCLPGRKMSDVTPGFLNSDLFDTCRNSAHHNQPAFLYSSYIKEAVIGREIDGYFDIKITVSSGQLVIILHDVTSVKKSELQLKKVADDLEEERNLLKDLLEENKRVTDALEKSEEDFRLLFENSFDAIFVMEIDGRINRCNSAAEKLFGYSEEELLRIGRPGFADKTDPRWPVALKERSETGKFIGVLNYIHKNGTVIPGETSSQIFRMNDGTLRISTVVRDVTGRIEAERMIQKASKQLQENQKRFERAEALANVGSWELNVKTGEMELSDEFISILGLESGTSKITLSDYFKIVHPEDRERLMQMSSSYHKEGRPLDIEYKIVRPDGQIRFIHGISDSFNEKGHKENIRYGAAMDITESKLQQIELLKTLEALERSNRDLEQFAYVASHDLQEPLRMVSTYSTMLQRKFNNDLDDKTKQYMSILIESSKRMNSLIQGLLDFSRINSAKQEFNAVDLNVLISDVLKDLSVLIMESKAEIKIDKLP